MSKREHADLRLKLRDDGTVDLALSGRDLDTTAGIDNLIQALQMRFLVYKGELARLSHPRYGSRVHELIGEPMDRANLGLLRRYVRQTILSDPRVGSIARLELRPLPHDPSAVEVDATIIPDGGKLLGPAFEFGVILDVG